MTLEEARARLALWEDALDAISRNQEYSLEGRSLKRADLGQVRATIDWLEARVDRLESRAAGRGRVGYVG